MKISQKEKAFLYLGLDCPELMPSTNGKPKVAKDDKVVCLTSSIITHKNYVNVSGLLLFHRVCIRKAWITSDYFPLFFFLKTMTLTYPTSNVLGPIPLSSDLVLTSSMTSSLPGPPVCLKTSSHGHYLKKKK